MLYENAKCSTESDEDQTCQCPVCLLVSHTAVSTGPINFRQTAGDQYWTCLKAAAAQPLPASLIAENYLSCGILVVQTILYSKEKPWVLTELS